MAQQVGRLIAKFISFFHEREELVSTSSIGVAVAKMNWKEGEES